MHIADGNPEVPSTFILLNVQRGTPPMVAKGTLVVKKTLGSLIPKPQWTRSDEFFVLVWKFWSLVNIKVCSFYILQSPLISRRTIKQIMTKGGPSMWKTSSYWKSKFPRSALCLKFLKCWWRKCLKSQSLKTLDSANQNSQRCLYLLYRDHECE